MEERHDVDYVFVGLLSLLSGEQSKGYEMEEGIRHSRYSNDLRAG